MKILIVPSWYPTEDSPLNGIFFKEQAMALQKYGHDVIVAYPELRSMRTFGKQRHSLGLSYKKEDGLKTYRYRSYNPIPLRISAGQGNVFYLLLNRLYDRIIQSEGKPDIIHAHSCLWGGVAAARLASRENIPLVITEHSSKFPRKLFKPHEKKMVKQALTEADKIISVGLGLKNELIDYIHDQSKLTVIPNIVDIDLFQMSQQSRDRETFRFFSLGFLHLRKGMDLLIKAFAKELKGCQAELIIGGSGPEMENLKRLSLDLGVSNQVKFLGQLDREGVLQQMQQCDVFALASHAETFGVVYIEALACGKPVIATSCGGPEIIVNEKNGLLVNVDDIDALGDAMVYMFKNIDQYDPQVLREDCVNRFSEKSIVSQLNDVYRSILRN
ncbi:glycosyltransferase family 4 protein [Siminovitchia sp. FSL H7-0308]|uniref:glycosyltransferase family 4 protein n=1 Tax=Siminovitchia sp. FSL H7-0308 TaxID=2921432 RepID=UPI0030EB148E